MAVPNGSTTRDPYSSPSALSSVVMLWPNRHIPRDQLRAQVEQLADSGDVDYVFLVDQMLGWWPKRFWDPKYIPLAGVYPDWDSYPDVFALAGFVSAHAPSLGIMVSPDAVRVGPAEMYRSMLTLADLTEGRAVLMLGAGEVKQCRPFGWKRSQGVKRFEDHMALYHELWNADGPFDWEGNFTTLDHAWLGGARRYKPQIWGMGGGPRLIEATAKYADGLTAIAPGVWPNAERMADVVTEVRDKVRGHGRDPDRFGFCPIQMALVHEDSSVIDQALDNPAIRWVAAIWGRFRMTDWRDEGYEPPFGDDWHYATNLLPHHMTDAFVDEVLSKVTREMTEKALLVGTPDEVAAKMQGYLDAGGNRILPVNWAPLVMTPDQIEGAQEANLELIRRLRKARA
jgi:phthiodiolone/phenolphthiodiolone dimycocerosates ketoreductase